MLLMDMRLIGNNLYAFRKKAGMTQIELAVASGLSERAYADIERGETNMRVGTLMKICNTLHITPNDLLTDDADTDIPPFEDLVKRMDLCTPSEKETAIRLLETYLQSLI